jgi:hypothetical protein
MNTDFEMKGVIHTKYGFKLRIRYYIDTYWYYNECKVKVKTYYKKNIIYEITISEDKYNSEIENIQKKMENGDYMQILVKDYGKCVACNYSITEEEMWLYDTYDIFCSGDCQRKPIADKCILCNSNIPRRTDWIYQNHCSIYCAAHNNLLKNTKLPNDIISTIIKKI